MRKTFALTDAHKATLMADLESLPAQAVYYRLDGALLIRWCANVVRVVRQAVFKAVNASGPILCVSFVALQWPDVSDYMQSADSKIADRRAALSFHVSGNTKTGVETMTQYLRDHGFTIARDETRADRKVEVHKVQFTPHDCRDNTMIRLQVKVTMPNDLPLQPFTTYPRYRYLSCNKESYTDYAGQFIKDIMADMTPHFDSYFLSAE